MKMIIRYYINSEKCPKNYVKSAKNAVFCWFGGSANFTEASAELFRPISTEASAEASAEASVSVVHYK